MSKQQTITFVSFVETVLRVTLTPAQRVLALVSFDGIEPGSFESTDRELAAALFGPIDTIPSQARGVLVLLKGARVGGSYIFGALYSLWRALTADLSTLARGEQAVALIVAPDLRLARQCLRYALGAAQGTPSIARLIESETSDSFVMRRSDGALVELAVLPATRGGSAVRGRTLVSSVMSESAFFRDDSAVVNDEDIFRAVAPRVIRGGMIVLESTPWTEAGLLFSLWAKNFGEPTTAIACHAPTLLMRPDDTTRGIVARERERDPDNADREFGAEFITGGSGLFFGPDLLGPAVIHGLEPDPYGPGQVTVGCDIGLVSDASAFVAVRKHEEQMSVIDVLEMKPKKGTPLKLSAVVQAGVEFAQRHGVRAIHCDHHVLGPAREYLPTDIAMKGCRGGQEALVARYLQTRDAFRQGRIRIPGKHGKIATQAALVASKPTPGGGTSIILPRRAGTHMDALSAFVLAVDAASGRHVNKMAAALLKLSADPIAMMRLQDELAGQARAAMLRRRF